VANDIAAGLEARGLGPTAPAAEIDSITLTTHHGAPVAVINGLAYGPADMTPAGVIGSELVGQWAARFAGQGQPDRAEAPAILRDLWDNARIDWAGHGVIHLSPAMTERLRAAVLQE